MSKKLKLIKKWESSKQDEELDTVLSVLDFFFGDCVTKKGHSGSHNYFVEHECLTDPKFGDLKQYHFPVKKNKVLPCYLKQIVEIIELKIEYDKENQIENIE